MSAAPSTAEFQNVCVKLLEQPGVSSEIAYRISKLMENIAALDDKVYLKTLKGKDTLSRCIEKAMSLQKHLSDSSDFPYRLLTDLEMSCEGLLVQSYQFRIKAG